jgi:RHS repeat-associated protein
MDSGGNFTVAWQSNGQDGSGDGVYAQRYAADGTTRDGEFAVNNYTTGSQAAPAIAMDAEGNFVASWAGEGHADPYGANAGQFRDTAETRLEYDHARNLTKATNPLGNSTDLQYDDANRLWKKLKPLGRETDFAYDAASQVTTVSVLSQVPTSVYEVTTITYMPRGQIDIITLPSGLIIDYGYCGCGCENAVAYDDNKGTTITTAIALDGLGRAQATTTDLKTTSYTYDVAGNLAAVTDANVNTTDMKYDALGRATKTTDALGHTLEQKYDKAGNPTSVTDSLGHTTVMTYDAQGRMKTSEDALGGLTTVTYDLAGRVETVTDPENNTTTYAYDVAGNRTVTTDPNTNDTVSKFDAAGELVRVKDRDNRVRAFTYNDAGDLSAEVWLDGGGTPVYTATYDYALDGQLMTAADNNSVYNYDHDVNTGLLLTLDNYGSPSMPQVTMTYDLSGLGIRYTAQDDQGGRVDYAYDASLRLTNVGLSVSSTAGAQVSMAYDDGGRLQEIHRQNGLSGDTIDTAFNYDIANRLTDIEHVSSNKGTLSVMTYAYDNANRLTGYTGPEGGRAYAYDDTNQLTTVTNTAGPTVLESFTYDANGNRLSANGVSYGTPDPGNRLTSDGVYSYDYDDEGNTTVKHKTGERWEYAYDYRNRLTEVKELTGVSGTVLYDAQYTYDVFDRRIGILEDADGAGGGSAVQTWTLYDGANAWADFDGGGTLIMRYLNGMGMDERYARQDAGGTVDWYLTDNVGSVRQLVRTDGTVRDAITYSAFGTPTDTHANQGDRFKFTGREYDAGAGQYYYRARYYGADVGRFRSEDPLGFAAGDTNVYRYAAGEPGIWADPTGHMPARPPALTPDQRELLGRLRRQLNDINDRIAEIESELQAIMGTLTGADPVFLSSFDLLRELILKKEIELAALAAKYQSFVRHLRDAGCNEALVDSLEKLLDADIDRRATELTSWIGIVFTNLADWEPGSIPGIAAYIIALLDEEQTLLLRRESLRRQYRDIIRGHENEVPGSWLTPP